MRVPFYDKHDFTDAGSSPWMGRIWGRYPGADCSSGYNRYLPSKPTGNRGDKYKDDSSTVGLRWQSIFVSLVQFNDYKSRGSRC